MQSDLGELGGVACLHEGATSLEESAHGIEHLEVPHQTVAVLCALRAQGVIVQPCSFLEENAACRAGHEGAVRTANFGVSGPTHAGKVELTRAQFGKAHIRSGRSTATREQRQLEPQRNGPIAACVRTLTQVVAPLDRKRRQVSGARGAHGFAARTHCYQGCENVLTLTDCPEVALEVCRRNHRGVVHQPPRIRGSADEESEQLARDTQKPPRIFGLGSAGCQIGLCRQDLAGSSASQPAVPGELGHPTLQCLAFVSKKAQGGLVLQNLKIQRGQILIQDLASTHAQMTLALGFVSQEASFIVIAKAVEERQSNKRPREKRMGRWSVPEQIGGGVDRSPARFPIASGIARRVPGSLHRVVANLACEQAKLRQEAAHSGTIAGLSGAQLLGADLVRLAAGHSEPVALGQRERKAFVLRGLFLCGRRTGKKRRGGQKDRKGDWPTASNHVVTNLPTGRTGGFLKLSTFSAGSAVQGSLFCLRLRRRRASQEASAGPPMVSPEDHSEGGLQPLGALAVARGALRLADVRIVQETFLVLETRPDEGGRAVLVGCALDGSAARDLIPTEHSCRNRVHEYGGGAYAVTSDSRGGLVFAYTNLSDGRLWLGSAEGVRPISPADAKVRFADLCFDGARDRLVCVAETHSASGSVENSIVAVSLATGTVATLTRGADFYSDPQIDVAGDRMLWLEWDHPDMPWDSTRLMVAEIRQDGGLGQARCLAGRGSSVFQPRWSRDGSIVFVDDASGYWNLIRHDLSAGVSKALCTMAADFGRPQWAFGMRTWAELGDGRIFCTFAKDGTWRGAMLEYDGHLRILELPFTELSDVSAAGTKVAFVGAAPDRAAAVCLYDATAGSLSAVRAHSVPGLEPARVSSPEGFWFATADGRRAHAFFYPPWSSAPGERAGAPPPAIVRAHGGPTAAASTGLRPEIQYWTSRGFAVVDVNYRGSTGFGRAYREQLNGRWGEADVADCAAAVRHLLALGKINDRRVAFTGGSAGGLTVLGALASSDVFAAAAVYYGVTDLLALARDTHKFEARYLDRLVGALPDFADVYRARSPAFMADRIRAPVVFFQGLDDQVVPPQQTRTMVEALRANGVRVEAHFFEGEGHSFRSAEVIAACLEAELSFFRDVFGMR